MLLRAAIVILVTLNLGAAGWWAFQPGCTVRPEALHAPELRLLSEPALAKADAAIENVPLVAQAEVAASEAPAPEVVPPAEAAPVPPTAVPAVCLRFGPFSDVQARDRVRQSLDAAGSRVNAHGAPATAARGWKVFLPVQPSRDAALALAERLKTAGVQDLFVMNKGEETNSIALGRFSNEAGARRRLTELQGKGFSAQLEPVGASPAQLWLDAHLAQPDMRESLAKLAPSQVLNCKQMR